jgi:hypothetical protein
MKMKPLSYAIASFVLPGIVAAQAPNQEAKKWEVRAAVYGYLPDIGGHTRFAAPGGGEIDIQSDDLVRNTELAGMVAIEAQKGRIGIFADEIYMDVGDGIANSPTLGNGLVPLPPGVTADAALDIEASVFTVAANLRVVDTERNTFDAFAGARMLWAEGTLDATLRSPLGPIVSIASTVGDDGVDAIVGVKGRVSLGETGRWFLPYYVDVGAGDADRTSQAAVGIGRTLRFGEVFGTYRYLDYDFKDESLLSDLDLSGPAIGISYRF